MVNNVEVCLQFLKGKGITVQLDWLEACIEWLVEENQTLPKQTALSNQVYEQWLLADLKEIAQPVLPKNVTQKSGVSTLNGKYFLQVNYVYDIGHSAYSQLQKYKGEEIDNLEEENEDMNEFFCRDTQTKNTGKKSSFNKRETSCQMLFFEMTDGVTTVEAIEYKRLTTLQKGNIQPGGKVLLTGPISCRNGLLLLKADCIEILGGNVEHLLEINSPVNLFNRVLRLHQDKKQSNQLLSSLSQKNPPHAKLLATSKISQNKPKSKANNMSKNASEKTLSSANPLSPSRQNCPENEFISNDLNNIFNEDWNDFDVLCASDNQKKHSNDNFKDVGSITEEILCENDLEMLDLMNDDPLIDHPNIINIDSPLRCFPITSSHSRSHSTTTSNCLHTSTIANLHKEKKNVCLIPEEEFNDDMLNIDEELEQAISDTKNNWTGKSIHSWENSRMHITGRNLRDIVYSSTPLSYTISINCSFKTLTSRLQFESGRYRLTAIITDGEHNVEVLLGNEVLQSVIGYSARHVQMAVTGQLSSLERSTVKKALTSGEKKLENENWLADITFDHNENTYAVVKMVANRAR